MRIVLSWGANPWDLDAHLLGDGGHVYFGSRTIVGANLDRDDVDSVGPETITIDVDKLKAGEYYYYVNWYHGNGSWRSSEAKVEIYMGDKRIAEYYCPQTETRENWVVFSVKTSTKSIMPNS